VLVSRITPCTGANHVAPPATKDEKEYRTRSPPRRDRRSSGSDKKNGGCDSRPPPLPLSVFPNATPTRTSLR
jgi:hypothetical protein